MSFAGTRLRGAGEPQAWTEAAQCVAPQLEQKGVVRTEEIWQSDEGRQEEQGAAGRHSPILLALTETSPFPYFNLLPLQWSEE